MNWTNFEKIWELPDWTDVRVVLSEVPPFKVVERFFADPRLKTLGGLRVASGRLYEMVRAHYPQLPNLEYLDVMLSAHPEGVVLPFRELLEVFPGIRTFRLQGAGAIEPARHGFVTNLYISTHLRTQPVSLEVWVNLQVLEALNACVFPALEALTLGFQGELPSSSSEAREVIGRNLPPILAGDTFPKLKRVMLQSVLDPGLAELFTEVILQCDKVAPDLECLYLPKGLFGESEFRQRLERWKPFQEGRLALEFEIP